MIAVEKDIDAGQSVVRARLSVILLDLHSRKYSRISPRTRSFSWVEKNEGEIVFVVLTVQLSLFLRLLWTKPQILKDAFDST